MLNNINDYGKKYIYSLSLQQGLHQKIIKCYTNYIPIPILPNVLNEEDIDIVIEEIVNKKDFEKSDCEIETFDCMAELNYPQDKENNSIIILDDLNEKEINNDKLQAMLEHGRHNNLSIFIRSQDYYELPNRTIRANGNIYHRFKLNNFLEVRIIYQDEERMDMTPDELKYLTSVCWDENYQPLIFDMTKDKFTGCYRLGLNSIFVPDSSSL